MGKKNGPKPSNEEPSRSQIETKAQSDQFLASFQALGEIERKLGVGAPQAALSLGLGDLCQQYREIKPLIETGLKFVDWLPHGGAIRRLIEILMELADKYCGSSATSLAASEGRSSPAVFGRVALERIEGILAPPSPAGAAVGAASVALGFGDEVCREYREIKKYISAALEFVEWLPYGPTISKVIRLLMRLADAVC